MKAKIDGCFCAEMKNSAKKQVVSSGHAHCAFFCIGFRNAIWYYIDLGIGGCSVHFIMSAIE
jgi:hypothetical protein